MSHLGVICPPVSGHLNPMAALGRELMRRGHRVTVFGIADIGPKVEAEGLGFVAIGQSDHPLGSLPESLARLGRLEGIPALRFTVAAIERTTAMICRDAPQALGRAGVEALLVDQTEPAGGSVAELLALPFITICNALALNREPGIPPIFTPWDARGEWWAKLRNQAGYAVFDQITRPVSTRLAEYRRLWKLNTHRTPDEAHSRLAQISQQPREFDFPRRALPACFHYTGPLRNASPAPVAFPWERLDGRPLVYASLGTLQNSKLEIFKTIAAACEPLAVQLVLSHGGGLNPEAVAQLPGTPLVVSYAPQLELLKRASLTITHAGLNTVLDSLTCGVPMVAIPITYEQPAIAARLRRCGAGEVLPHGALSRPALEVLVRRVLDQPTYRRSAGRLAASIALAGGAGRAADIIERVLRGNPVAAG